MLELINIFIFPFIFLLIFSFPFNIFGFQNKNLIFGYNFNIFEKLIFNILIIVNLLLLFSIIGFNIIYLFYIFLFIASFNVINLVIKKKINYKTFINQPALLYFYFVNVILFIDIAYNPILSWDAAAHWIFKAQTFYQGGEIQNLDGLPSDHYPHLGSYLWAFFWKNSFIQNEYFGRFVYPFFLTVCVFSINLEAKKNQSIFLILISCIIFTTYNRFLMGGYQEYLLFFAFFCLSKIILFQNNLYKKKNISYLLIIFYLLSMNILLWAKQEGFFHFFISFFLLNYLLYFQYKKRKLFTYFYIYFVTLLMLSLFLFIKLHYYGSLEFSTNSMDEALQLLNFSTISYKLLLVIKYIIINIFKYPVFLVIILTFLYAIIVSRYFKNKIYILYFVILEFLFIFSIFIFIDDNIEWLLPLTLGRIMFPICGFLINDSALILNKILKKNKFIKF